MRTTFYTVLIGMIMMISTSLSAQCPTVFCQDLNTAFMAEACMVEVWSKDFVNKIDMGDIPVDDYWISFEEDSLVMNRIFRSEDGNIQTVDIWVAENPDGSGCKSRCEVILKIRDNSGECPEEEFLVCPIEVNPWCGYAVLTCSADTEDDLVASILDVRRNDLAPSGDDWTAPVGGGDTLNMIEPPAWRLGNLGMVFGMARKIETGEIFFAASDIYAYDYAQLVQGGFVSVGFPPPTATGSAGPAGVYRTTFGTDPNAITVNPIIFTNGSTYLEEADVIGGSEISNFGNFDGTVPDPAGLTNHFEQFDSMGTTTGNGLGNISYDRRSNHLFVSNLEDGKLYSINCATNRITDVYDPFNPYNHSVDGPGIVEQDERVWGVSIRQCAATTELYFARNTTNDTPVDNESVRSKSIYKIDISPSGRFVQENGGEDLVLTVDRGFQEKFTDITFDIDCEKMLLAERGHPHEARVFEYELNGSVWIFQQQPYVGIYDPNDPAQPNGKIVGSSTGGGVTYGPSSDDSFIDSDCDQLIWSTVQCGDPVDVPGRCDIYGLQGINVNGNDTLTSGATDIYVGLQPDPGDPVSRLKNNLGDVDIFNCCCPGEPANPVNTGTAIVSGHIYTPVGMYTHEAMINIESNEMSMTSELSSSNYVFEGLEMYKNYKIYPEIAADGLDGLSTLDAVLIQQHILGIREFQSDYQLIAADVNGSGSVSAHDLIDLRKYLLGKKTVQDDIWKAIDKNSYDQRSAIQEILQIQNLQLEASGADFVAVKSGDVNFDNKRYNLANTRSTEVFDIWWVRNDATGTYDFYAAEEDEIIGIQIGINSNSTLHGSALMHLTESNYSLNDKELKISWNTNSIQPILVHKNELLFRINTESGENDPRLINEFSSEIYTKDFVAKSISLEERIQGKENHSQKGVGLISPNPFAETFTIQLPLSNDTYRVEVYTVDGRRVYKKENIKSIEYEMIDIDLSENKESGLLIVHITSDSFNQISRVVKLD